MVFNNSILLGAAAAQGGGGFYPQTIEQSLKFNDDESQYLSWTPDAAGNRKTWTWSAWVKRGQLGIDAYLLSADLAQDSTGNNRTLIGFGSNNVIKIESTSGGGNALIVSTPAVFRDPSAWYHVVVYVDTTQATATNRVKIYVNGVLQSLTITVQVAQNADLFVNNTNLHRLSSNTLSAAGGNYFDGYLSDVYFIDGQALDPTSFGQFKEGVWVATSYAGTYGTNGFHLTFQDDVVSEGFNTVTYTGTGADQSISGLGFEPDLVWIKSRSGAYSHNLSDSVRGGNLGLTSNGTNAEYSLSPANTFDTDGFTLNQTNNQFNASGVTYVAWAWDAGSGSPVSNTDGSITSTVKANPSYGFSIASYVGTGSAATVGHSLGVQPSMIIVKNRDTATWWDVYHGTLGGTKYLRLNSTGSQFTGSVVWNDTDPTSSVFSVGTVNDVNASGENYIAYCFAEVAGYSSFGSYSGNGSTSDNYDRFPLAFVMIKALLAHSLIGIFDNTRIPLIQTI